MSSKRVTQRKNLHSYSYKQFFYRTKSAPY